MQAFYLRHRPIRLAACQGHLAGSDAESQIQYTVWSSRFAIRYPLVSSNLHKSATTVCQLRRGSGTGLCATASAHAAGAIWGRSSTSRPSVCKQSGLTSLTAQCRLRAIPALLGPESIAPLRVLSVPGQSQRGKKFDPTLRRCMDPRRHSVRPFLISQVPLVTRRLPWTFL